MLKDNNFPEIKININKDKWIEIVKDNYENTILLFITGKCNLNCSYCFNIKNLKDNDMMELDYIKKIVKANPWVNKYDIQWWEPLMHPQINEIIRYLQGKWKKVWIYTNWYLLKKLNKEHKWLKIWISFQSITSNNKSLKPIADVLQNLIEYQNYYSFKLVFLLNNNNSIFLEKFVDIIDKKLDKVKWITIWSVRDESNYWSDEKDFVLPFIKYSEIVQNFINNYKWRLNIDIFSKWVLRSEKLPSWKKNQINRFKNVFSDKTYVPCLYLIANDDKKIIADNFKIPFPNCNKCWRTWKTNCLADKIYLKKI